jgi:hypothetical protein
MRLAGDPAAFAADFALAGKGVLEAAGQEARPRSALGRPCVFASFES